MHYHVRQIRSGRISLELLSAVAVKDDGSERPYVKPIPISYEIASVKAPPGWQIYLMPDPSWPRDNTPLPAIRCEAGDVLPLSPGPRTLVAVQGDLGPDGAIGGKAFLAWGYPIDAWHRTEVLPDNQVVAYRKELEIEVEPEIVPGSRLGISMGERYQDAAGDWFHDPEATFPAGMRARWRWTIGGGVVAALVLAAWAVRRRRRARPRT